MSKQTTGFKTRRELAIEMNITPITLSKKIQPIRALLKAEKPKRLYSPGEVEIIREYFGVKNTVV